MSKIEAFVMALARKKLGDDFEQKVMEYIENQSCDKDELIGEIIGHYEAILRLLAPDYQCVKLDRDDLLTIYIDDVEYDLDDQSSAKGKKAAEHRMAIECLLTDVSEDDPDIFTQLEKHLNRQ